MALPEKVSRSLFYWAFGGTTLAPTVLVMEDHPLEIGSTIRFTVVPGETPVQPYIVVREVSMKDLKTALRSYISIFSGSKDPKVPELKAHLDSVLEVEVKHQVNAYLIEPA